MLVIMNLRMALSRMKNKNVKATKKFNMQKINKHENKNDFETDLTKSLEKYKEEKDEDE